jgi:hypothetical protein
MSSDLADLIEKVELVINDEGYSDSTIASSLNNAMVQIAGGIERVGASTLTSPLPGLFMIDTVVTSTTDYRVLLPDDYQRDVVFASDSYGRELEIFDSFNDYAKTYPLMNQAGSVNALAIKGNYLYYQPVPAVPETITIHYHRLPVDMVVSSDVPDGLPVQFRDLLVYFAIKEFFSVIEDGLDGGSFNYTKWEQKFMQMLMRMDASIPADTAVMSF